MTEIVKIKCPNCGIEEMSNQLSNLDYSMDENGIFHWECFECSHEWKGNYKGEENK